MSSIATTTGITFPGISHVTLYDVTNQFVQVKLNPWTVYQPGIDQMVTVSADQTYTVAAFLVLEPKMNYTSSKVTRASYSLAGDQWTQPPMTGVYWGQ